MRRRHLLAAASGGAAAVLLAAPAIVRAAAAAQPFRFSLNWFPVGDHCAYWVALDRGYYAREGLDVSFENSKGSGDSLAKVATGRVEMGLGEAAPMMAAVSRGAELRIVGMVFDRTPLNVFSRKDAPALQPKDLEGHTIGAPPGDSQRQVWPAFARINGLDASKVTWVNIEPTAKVAALSERRVDLIADYTTGLPLYEKAMGKGTVAMMPWARFGLDMYSMSIVASEQVLARQKDAVRGFLAASYQGWRDVMADPAAALAIYKRRVPEIDLGFIEENMALGVELMRTPNYAAHGLGWMDAGKMAATVDLVNTYMGLPRKMDAASVYTNDYLTRVEMPVAAT